MLWMTTGLQLRGRLRRHDLGDQPEPGGHHHPGDPRHAEGRRAQPGDRLRGGRRSTSQAWFDAEEGKLDPFVLVIEGSLGNEKINGEGHWTGFGVNPENGQPITTNEWLDRLAPKAAAVVAVGTCATYGGIPAMKNNPTGAMGVPDYLGWNWKSKAGLPGRVHPRLPRPAGQHDRDRCSTSRCTSPGSRPRPTSTSSFVPRGCSAAPCARAATAPASPRRATSPPSTAPTTAAWSSSAARARS